MTQKYKFICEDTFNNTNLTLETSAVSLDQLLTDFADFLRGAGFQINGYLDVIDPDEQFPENACDSEYITLNDYDTMDYDHPEANFDWNSTDSLSLYQEDKLSLCPVCKLDTNMMKEHSCYDKHCPKGS